MNLASVRPSETRAQWLLLLLARSDDTDCRPSLTKRLVGFSADCNIISVLRPRVPEKKTPARAFAPRSHSLAPPASSLFSPARPRDPPSAMRKEPLLTQLASSPRALKRTCSISQSPEQTASPARRASSLVPSRVASVAANLTLHNATHALRSLFFLSASAGRRSLLRRAAGNRRSVSRRPTDRPNVDVDDVDDVRRTPPRHAVRFAPRPPRASVAVPFRPVGSRAALRTNERTDDGDAAREEMRTLFPQSIDAETNKATSTPEDKLASFN